MDFSVNRASLLRVLGIALDLPEQRQSAFLGRFQHLQRLQLVVGINPGRGKAAEYRGHQVVVIALACQLLQLGITPERAVAMIKANEDRVRLAIGLAIGNRELKPSFLWFDAALLSQSSDQDRAEETFDYGGAGVVRERFDSFFGQEECQRMAFVSVTNTIFAIGDAIPRVVPNAQDDKAEVLQRAFIQSVRDWYKSSTPDSLD